MGYGLFKENTMSSTVVEKDFPYDIIKRGDKDANRHNKRVDDAVRKQLKDIIGQHEIITREGNKKVKVRVKGLTQYRWIHSQDRVDTIGRDEFDDLDEGEIIYRPDENKSGDQGLGTGDANDNLQDGEEVYEAEYTMDELTDMMIQELELPDLDETKHVEVVSPTLEWNDRRRYAGIRSALDKRRTLIRYLKRKSKSEEEGFINDDLVFKTWDEHQEKHSNAVVFLMMDRSYSMEEDKIYMVKALYFWIVNFLRRKYNNVEIRFISHDLRAKEMSEKDFFTISHSGGTKVSSAYKLCRDIIKNNYPPEMWNIYCFHSSDGDSWHDESLCMDLVEDIVALGAKLFAYSEINLDKNSTDESNLMMHFAKLTSKKPEVLVSTVQSKSDILTTLNKFLMHSTRREMEKK